MILNNFVISLLTIILSTITAIHIYWFFGGEKGLDASLPHDITTIKKKFSKLTIQILNMVLIAPVIATLLILILSFYSIIPILDTYKPLILYTFSIIFTIRGLTGWLLNKWSKKESFKKQNTFIYSPISFTIGILLYILYSNI
jgi:hypothetical protein